MDDFNKSMNDIKLLIYNALESEETSQNKLYTYRKYVKGMSALFVGLDKDLENYPLGFDERLLKMVSQRHLSMLQLGNQCLTRSIAQLEDSTVRPKSDRCMSTSQCLEIRPYQKPSDLRSLPGKKSIDILLSEKPLNPIDSAKFNLQNVITNTKKLLQSEKLTSSQRISVQLKLSRMIEETLSIARKREESICKVKTNDLELLQTQIECDLAQYSIFRCEGEMSALYRTSILFYHHILKGSKWYELAQLDRCPELSCLSFILRMNDSHPIVLHIDKIIGLLLSNKNDAENNERMTLEIKTFTEKIQTLSMVCCMIGNVNSAERNCNSSHVLFNLLCEFIFNKANVVKFIYDFLFISGESYMAQYNDNVKLTREANLDSFLIPEKLNRYPSIKEIIDNKILLFSELRTLYNPLLRMSKLCEIITGMMSSIKEKNPKMEIGADELVPILSYMMIMFDSAEIFLHIKYLEVLTPSDCMMGIEGYILVSVCCAITYCTSDKFETYLPTNK